MATASDTNMVEPISIVESRFLKFCHELPPALCKYHQFCDHLYTVDGIIIYKAIALSSHPPSANMSSMYFIQRTMYQGMSYMTALAETTTFWPGIITAITPTQTNCHHCNRMTPSQLNVPPFPPVLPSYLFQCISADFFPLQE